MKIRTGFVSNSSSSAFILIVKKDEFDRVFPMMDSVQQFFCKENFYQVNMLGIQTMQTSSLTVQDCSSLEDWRPPSSDRELYVDKYDGYPSEVRSSIIALFAPNTHWSTRIGD